MALRWFWVNEAHSENNLCLPIIKEQMNKLQKSHYVQMQLSGTPAWLTEEQQSSQGWGTYCLPWATMSLTLPIIWLPPSAGVLLALWLVDICEVNLPAFVQAGCAALLSSIHMFPVCFCRHKWQRLSPSVKCVTEGEVRLYLVLLLHSLLETLTWRALNVFKNRYD